MSSKEDVFDVQDMHCNACVNTITKTLTNNSNIDNVDCDLDTKEVKVTYDDEQVDVEEILSALDTIGFPATIKKNHKCWRHDLCHVFQSSNLRSIKNARSILSPC